MSVCLPNSLIVPNPGSRSLLSGVLVLHHSVSTGGLHSECCVLRASCGSGWVGGRGSSQAESGRLEWISSVIQQPPGVGGVPHAKGRGHKFNSLVCWSHRNHQPPLIVCVCVQVAQNYIIFIITDISIHCQTHGWITFSSLSIHVVSYS